MIKFIRIGIRNIIRHRRRTLLIFLMISTVVAITLVLEGFIEATQQGWLTSIIHSETGHIQIMRKGYREKQIMAPLDLLIPEPQAIESLLEKNKTIVGITKRLLFSGMAASKDKTIIFTGIGADPVTEYDIFDLIDVRKGTRLQPHKPFGAMVGSGLAKNLDLGIGNNLVLITNTIEGAMNAIDVEIVGIFQSGVPQVDSMTLFVPLAAAQQLLNVPGQASYIALLLKDIKLVEKEAAQLKQTLKNFSNLEVFRWQDLATLYKRIGSMNRFQANTIEIILFSLIALAICIIMLMAVFERTREIGTMTAFGVKKSEILSLFLCESTMIGVIGGFLGILIGIGIIKLLFFIGIPFNPPGSDMTVYIRPIVLYDRALYVFSFSTLTTIIGGLYPAAWASQIRPVEALRFV